MAREILFKAKRIDNGEWVEGNLIYKKSSVGENTFCLIVGSAEWTNDGQFYNLCNTHFIHRDTICQYTGLTDKNGNKIWENDVVRHLEHGEIYKCYWYCENCEYSLCNESESFGLGYCVGTELEVIGNIFDNPEL